jgi:hypothetical protein
MITERELNNKQGEVFEVRMKAFEVKDEYLQKIRFQAKCLFTNTPSGAEKKKYFLRINELLPDTKKLNPLIVQKEMATYNPED